MLIFFSSYQLGARDSLYLVGTLVLFHTMSAILAIKYGHRKISRFDVLCLTTAFMGTALWIVTKDPITALVLNVAVDFAGMSIICWKLYQLPGSEDRIAWGGSSIFYGINLLAVSSWNVGQFLFPISNFVTCTTIFLLTFRKENHLQMPRSSL